MQQALEYAGILDVPFAYSSNGDAFLEHDRTTNSGTVTRELPLDQFPSPAELWSRYCAAKGFSTTQETVATQDYYANDARRPPRYYQLIAINRTVEAIAQGENRVLLVMATGTGKTYTAFQIIWRLWKSGAKKRILFLVDRNILADQTKTNDFKPFGQAMTKITNRTVDKSFEIYLCLYQAVTGTEEDQNIYKQFSPDFFDLVIVDECHRGSAADDARWRQVLEYFTSATQIGLTATPKETKDVSNIEYFGDPIYTYSLKQGIDDGFLAPYKVVRLGLDKDLDGWRPESGQTDKYGRLIEDREYNSSDFDRNLILEKRTALVAAKITDFLRSTDRFAKTIVFCENIDHAERMRQALVNANPDLAAANAKYVMRITGDNDEGKAQLDNFIDPESVYPVIACTSRLMSTGVDAQTCRLIVLDRRIASMLPALAKRLAAAGLKRVDTRELRRFRLLYTIYPQIRETVTPELLARVGGSALQPLLHFAPLAKRETLSPKSPIVETSSPQLIQRLSFSHLSELLELPDATQRRFYEIECIRGNWSVRELRRQIDSLYYERSGLSKNKAKLSAKAHAKAETLQPAQIIRDPYIFEFLGLRAQDAMGESDLEDALLDRLQEFLLEMGHGFCFEARQKRLLIGDEHFFVDLVFYHRVLKCHVLVELKTAAFTHEHLGQLNTYVAYYKKHEMTPGDQPPIGILLCTRKNEALVEFALGDLPNKLFVSRYAVEMPKKQEMETFLKQLGKELAS